MNQKSFSTDKFSFSAYLIRYIFIFSTTISLCCFIAATMAHAQPDSISTNKYERTSITFCLLNFDNQSNPLADAFKTLQVNDKFNNHTVTDMPMIDSPFDRQYILQDRYKLLKKKIASSDLPKKMIEKWFCMDQNGQFSMRLISERGLYNATNEDVIKANISKKGMNQLKDAGESLINKTYIVVLDFYNASPNAANRFMSATIAYIYKIDWNDSIASEFYNKAWSSPDYLKKMTFPIEYVSQVYVSNYGSGIDLQNAAEKVMKEAAKAIPDFRVRNVIDEIKPIRSNIGTKENVKTDQKFIVYEQRVNKRGKIVLKKYAGIRATNQIANNSNSEFSNNSSTIFYQDGGKRLYKGLLIEQRYELGIGISAGWAVRTLQGPLFRLECNLSGLLKIPMFKLFAEAQIGSDNVKFGNGTNNYQVNSTTFAIGLSKEFILTRNIHFESSLAFVFDTTGFQFNDKERYDITHDAATFKPNGLITGYQHTGLLLGLRLPINILHTLQLVPAVCLTTYTYPNTGLFGHSLPQDLSSNTIDEMQIDKSKSGWYKNHNANMNTGFLKYEVTLRLKL